MRRLIRKVHLPKYPLTLYAQGRTAISNGGTFTPSATNLFGCHGCFPHQKPHSYNPQTDRLLFSNKSVGEFQFPAELLAAVFANKPALVEACLKRNPYDPEIRDPISGKTLLDIARELGYTECYNALVRSTSANYVPDSMPHSYKS